MEMLIMDDRLWVVSEITGGFLLLCNILYFLNTFNSECRLGNCKIIPCVTLNKRQKLSASISSTLTGTNGTCLRVLC